MKKTGRIVIGLTAISLIGTFIIFPYLPDNIPIHWNVDGSINTAYKGVAFITALFPLGIYLLKIIIRKVDPRAESYEKHKKSYNISILTAALILFAVHWAGLFYSLGYNVDVVFIVKILTGIVFIVLGNYMSQIRQNYFFGIKNPWTFASEEVWKRTHRVGGYVFILGGIILAVSAFFSRYISLIVTLGVVFIIVFFNIAYSYITYRKLKSEK